MNRPMIRYLNTLSLATLLAMLLAACGSAPAAQPTMAPAAPTAAPAAAPTAAPVSQPTAAPTTAPVSQPTAAPAADAQPLKVVATYSILGDLVQQVAGDRVTLTTLVGPGSDPHVYEPTPRDSAALAEANLLFENGLLFESWIDDLFVASGSQATRVVVSENITPLPAPEGGHSHEDPLAHACEHFADTPEAVTAGEGATIPDDHTHYVVALPGGAGAVALTRDEDAEVNFYLGADAPFAVSSGGAPLSPEAREAVTEGCDAVAIVYTFDLAPGDYTVSFGPGAGNSIALVWEVAKAHGEEEAHDHGEEEAHGHSHGEYDPHVWHDPNNAMAMVESIRDALAAADRANAAIYEANAAAYLARLKELDAFVAEQVATLPAERRKLVTTHDTFGYFAERYGFEVLGTALGVTTETSDPSAGEIAELVETIRAAGVPAIFAENIANPALMETIAREAGVKLAPTLFTDALGEPGSAGATYLDMVRYNVTTIVQALAG